MKDGNPCGRGEMTRTRNGEVEGCDNDKMECTDEDKCLGKQ